MGERFLCTPVHPWRGEPGPVSHSIIEEIGEPRDGWPSGDIVTYRCENCGHTWEQELPQ